MNEKNLRDASSIQDFVKDYYGKQLAASEDLKTNACCATGAPPAWIASTLMNVHEDVTTRFYGCGFPIPHAVEGATVVDLGSGTGRDVYVLSQLVGADGFVHGVDMTEEQLAVARDTVGWHMDRFGYEKPNVAFHQGYIEDLSTVDIADVSVDVVVSNCVVNLSPRKDLVMSEVARILKNGGEFYFSDVFCDRRLPADIANDPVLHAECLGGAMYRFDFVELAKKVGFADPRIVEEAPITIQNAEIENLVGAARFTSVTYRLFKIPSLEGQCEDYGQVATYKGGIPGAERVFWLDDRRAFEAGRPERICGNTADMLTRTRFAPFFDVVGDMSTHFGPHPCDPTMAATIYTGNVGGSSQPASTDCAPGGGCC